VDRGPLKPTLTPRAPRRHDGRHACRPRRRAGRADLRPERPDKPKPCRPAATTSRPGAARRRDGEERDRVNPCWRPSTHPPPSRRLSLRWAILRSCGLTAVRRRPDLTDAPRRDTRPALGALLDAVRAPGVPPPRRALACLLGGERATRRGEPSRDVATRGWGAPWEYRSGGDLLLGVGGSPCIERASDGGRAT
jgi:hypothetical protein